MATNNSTMNVTDLCRLCAAKDDFTKDLMDESNKIILNLIQELIQIKIYDYDNMSTKICLNCEEKLFSFHLFILECKKVQENMRNMSTTVASDDVKIKEEIALPITSIKSEIKDEYLAEDIISQTVHDDDFPGFDRSADDTDHGSSLEDDFSIAALKRLKKKQVISKTLPEGKVVNLTDLLKLNNLSDFVRMICKYCDKEFANFKKLNYHCNRHHMCKPVVQCICGLEMKSKTVIYKHVQDHKVIANDLKQERKYINVKETNLVNFDCNICQEKFCSYYSLKAHSVDKHGSSPVIQCQCGALLKSKSVLYKHIAEHKKPNVFSCDKCSKIVKSLSALEKHKSRHIPKEERTFECDSCDRTFNTKESLKSHMRCHIPIEQRKQYECEICFLKFTTRSSALSHKRVVHDKIKAYVCDLCGYACGTNGELRQHRAIHSDDKPFVCSKCSKRFKTYSNLKTHMDTHEETSYMCYVCSRILNSRRTLKKHLLVHENECRHICSYCNKAFKRRQTLKVHMSTHTGDKPLSCKWCDERFAYASTLRSHRLRYHPDKMIGGHAPNPYTQDYNSANHVGNEENLKSDGNVSYTENVGVSKSENITR